MLALVAVAICTYREWRKKEIQQWLHSRDSFLSEPGFAAKLYAVAAKWPQSNIIRAAAWKEETNLTFFRAKDNRASSVFERGGQGKDKQTKATTVPAVNLTAFMQKVIKPGDVVLMKMDIEGAEYEILPSLISSALLCNLTSAYFEWHPNVLSQEQLPNHFKLKAELDAQLSRCGTTVDHEGHTPMRSVVQPNPRRHSYDGTISSFSRPPKYSLASSDACILSALSRPHGNTAGSRGNQSSFDDNPELVEKLIQNKRGYCHVHGYKCVLLLGGEASNLTLRHPSWGKIELISRVLEQRLCEWAVWVDMDTVFLHMDQPLPLAELTISDVQLGFAAAGTGLNAGVLLFRQGKLTQSFLRAVWQLNRAPSPWEQFSIIRILSSNDTFRSHAALLPLLTSYPRWGIRNASAIGRCDIHKCLPLSRFTSSDVVKALIFHATGSSRERTTQSRTRELYAALTLSASLQGTKAPHISTLIPVTLQGGTQISKVWQSHNNCQASNQSNISSKKCDHDPPLPKNGRYTSGAMTERQLQEEQTVSARPFRLSGALVSRPSIVGICIAGMARSLMELPVMSTFQMHVKSPLQAQGYTTDVHMAIAYPGSFMNTTSQQNITHAYSAATSTFVSEEFTLIVHRNMTSQKTCHPDLGVGREVYGRSALLAFFSDIPVLRSLNNQLVYVPSGGMTDNPAFMCMNDHIFLCPREKCSPYFTLLNLFEHPSCNRIVANVSTERHPDAPLLPAEVSGAPFKLHHIPKGLSRAWYFYARYSAAPSCPPPKNDSCCGAIREFSWAYVIVRERTPGTRTDCPHPHRSSLMCCQHRLGPKYQSRADFNATFTIAECLALERRWLNGDK